MRDLDQLRERHERGARSDDGNASGRKLGLLALAGTLSVAAIISLGVVSGSSGERDVPTELDPLSQLVLSADGVDPKAPPPARKSPVQVGPLSFPTTLGGDVSAPGADLAAISRGADEELAQLHGGLPRPQRARAADVPASTLATEQSDRLSRAAKHDPLIAQAMPERGGVVAPSGFEGAFTLQVVSYETRDAAERFANALRARGHHAFVTPSDVPGRGRSFRVRIGPFTTRRDALQYQTRFEHDERMHSILVTSPPK